MKFKLLSLWLGAAAVSYGTGASAATSTFNLNWASSSLEISSGSGQIQFFGDNANVLTQIVTDRDTKVDFGFQSSNLQLGGNNAFGTRGALSTKMVENGTSQVSVESFYAAAIDLAAGAHGVFKIPYAWTLDAKSVGDVSAYMQYSFETVNFGLDGGTGVPSHVYRDGLLVERGKASAGQSFVEIYLDNTTNDTLRFALYQNTSAGSRSELQSAVPEPSVYALMGSGFGLFALLARRRKRPMA